MVVLRLETTPAARDRLVIGARA